MSDQELNEYLEFAKNLALQAGLIMQRNFSAGVKKEWKEDTTPLTETDTAINRLVIEKISQKYPGHSVKGEEENHNLGNKLTWVCDPVDGTMPFSHGLPISTFAIGLVEEGEPKVGVVYDPYMKRLFWAAKGLGAFLNGNPIKVPSKAEIKNSLVDIEGFPVASDPVVDSEDDLLLSLNAKGIHITHLWSGILPAALVAAGEFAAVIYNVPKPEEGAATKVIVEEAGGKVTDLFGNDQRYDQPTKGLILSNGHIHQVLVDAIAGLGPKS